MAEVLMDYGQEVWNQISVKGQDIPAARNLKVPVVEIEQHL